VGVGVRAHVRMRVGVLALKRHMLKPHA
jgi:hypothetical protein